MWALTVDPEQRRPGSPLPLLTLARTTRRWLTDDWLLLLVSVARLEPDCGRLGMRSSRPHLPTAATLADAEAVEPEELDDQRSYEELYLGRQRWACLAIEANSRGISRAEPERAIQRGSEPPRSSMAW